MDAEALLAEAAGAAEKAYAPYSDFRVGAVAVAADGTLYPGANVENAAYGSTLCAETVAIGHAVASGARQIDTVAVVCLDATGDCYPCGNCRQLMQEFGVKDLILRGAGGEVRRHTLDELLPDSFGPENLLGREGD